MKFILIILIALTLSACALISVQDYSDGENRYWLTATGTVSATKEGLLEKLHEKANKLCNGKTYDFLGDSDVSVASQIIETLYGPVKSYTKQLTRQLKCK